MAEKKADTVMPQGMSNFIRHHSSEEPTVEDVNKPTPIIEAKPVEQVPAPKPAKEAAPVPKEDSRLRDDQGRFLSRTTQRPEQEVDETIETRPAKAKEEAPTPVQATTNWDDESNPWKKKVSDLEKRQKDTFNWGNQAHQRAIALEQNFQRLSQQLEITNKKLDGTYDPVKDVIPEPPQPTVQDVANLAATHARVHSSKAAAYRQFGQEKVDPLIDEFNAVFGQDPIIQQRVLLSDMPVFEAMAAINGYHFVQKYGNDPEAIINAIKKQVIDEEMPKLRKEEEEKLRRKEDKRNSLPRTLANAKGDSTIPTGGSRTETRTRTLGEIFNH